MCLCILTLQLSSHLLQVFVKSHMKTLLFDPHSTSTFLSQCAPWTTPSADHVTGVFPTAPSVTARWTVWTSSMNKIVVRFTSYFKAVITKFHGKKKPLKIHLLFKLTYSVTECILTGIFIQIMFEQWLH